ncbi:hypothetical protein GCE9029_01418 [Grimontia celer]|uniref:Uncharacterized protein n=1 Tax=Grimontia celer TaxID=1796497 RepID=A0A128EYV0_9GAMM|nr:hypothetical protein [Grimontia celer]CZF79364.1 hypothetical protein GCE9029_01418 [Grimontia celer]
MAARPRTLLELKVPFYILFAVLPVNLGITRLPLLSTEQIKTVGHFYNSAVTNTG